MTRQLVQAIQLEDPLALVTDLTKWMLYVDDVRILADKYLRKEEDAYKRAEQTLVNTRRFLEDVLFYGRNYGSRWVTARVNNELTALCVCVLDQSSRAIDLSFFGVAPQRNSHICEFLGLSYDSRYAIGLMKHIARIAITSERSIILRPPPGKIKHILSNFGGKVYTDKVVIPYVSLELFIEYLDKKKSKEFFTNFPLVSLPINLAPPQETYDFSKDNSRLVVIHNRKALNDIPIKVTEMDSGRVKHA